jgi:hypothetical protein
VATAIDFPAALPKADVSSLEETSTEAYASDPSEVGSARRRARFTRVLRRWSWTAVLTAAQRAALDTFYEVTLSNGVATFNWTHPITEVSYEVQFADRPAVRHFMGTHYSTSIGLEQV